MKTSTIMISVRRIRTCRFWCGPIRCNIWIPAKSSKATNSRISPRPIPGRCKRLSPDKVARLGGFMVWDLNKNQAVPIHRELVGWHFRRKSGIDAALTGTYRVKTPEQSGSRRDADFPNVPSALAGLRSRYRSPNLPYPQRFDCSLGAG